MKNIIKFYLDNSIIINISFILFIIIFGIICYIFRRKIKELYLKYKEIINYIIVGGLTTIVSLIAYYTCVLTFLDPNNPVELQIANVISWICAVTFAYIANRIFVFESKNTDYVKEISSFVGARVATLLMDMGIMFVFVTLLKGNDKIIKLIVQVVVTILNYIFSKIFVFKKEA